MGLAYVALGTLIGAYSLPGTVVPLLLMSLVWAPYNGGCVSIVFNFVPAFFVAHGMRWRRPARRPACASTL